MANQDHTEPELTRRKQDRPRGIEVVTGSTLPPWHTGIDLYPEKLLREWQERIQILQLKGGGGGGLDVC